MAISPGGRPADASPLGKGPRKLSDYTREIAHALMRAGHPESEAIAIAREAERRFAVKSKNPAIRAAALKATAEDKVLSHNKVDMARKIRPGSIPSGPGKGKFPVTSQASLDSAIQLRKHAKGVSQKVVIAHLKAEARKRGLKIPKTASLTVPSFISLRGAGPSLLDLDWSAYDANRPAGQQQPAQQPDLLTAQTHQNIAAFQKAHGLPPTGEIDAATVKWLNDPKNSAAAQKAAAGAAKKNASATAAAAKKAAAAQKKLANQQAAAAKKATAQQAAQQKAATKAAAAQQVAATKAGKAALGYQLSVPLTGSDDGVRMTGNAANFGGKKAAPFAKGGGRVKQKNVRALNMENLKRAQAARAAAK